MKFTLAFAFLSCSLLTLLTGASTAAADISITVAAGEHNRVGVPLRVPITLPKELAGAKTAQLVLANPKIKYRQVVLGQITEPSLLAGKVDAPAGQVARELCFILPRLKAGATATASKVQIPAPVDKSVTWFSWHDTQGKHAELRHVGRPVMRYMYEAIDESSKGRREQTYKVYHHVFDPRGARLMTKGPGGLFTHHRMLFFGFNRISYGKGQKADIWHCRGGTHQAHAGFVAAETGPVLGRHRLAIDWHGNDKKVFAKEQREMTAYAAGGGIMIDFATRLASTVGPIQLDGDPQHAGFQFRATQDVPDKTKKMTYYLRPDGKGKPGSYRNWPGAKTHVNLPWNALSIVVDEKRYTVCYLDHPNNPKEARYSERDYGRFGSYFATEIDTGKPLTLNYRIWLQEGEMTVAQVSAHSRAFVQPPTVTVKVK